MAIGYQQSVKELFGNNPIQFGIFQAMGALLQMAVSRRLSAFGNQRAVR